MCAVVGLISNNSDKQSHQAGSPTLAATAPQATVAGDHISTTAKTASASPSPSPKVVAMPNVVGKNAAVAMDELERLGFTKIQLGSQDREDTVVILAANWTVTKQSTAAGTEVPTDVLIVLTCTKKA
ncbi:PASTA domain-containing protein [Dactylosporangium sp. CA-139114]|uniref:PASTA domain-containing protein n=1 Tax=Dactylosporangium sp. CA-139114 TaxID=3239931 RepID=UPI003D98445C